MNKPVFTAGAVSLRIAQNGRPKSISLKVNYRHKRRFKYEYRGIKKKTLGAKHAC